MAVTGRERSVRIRTDMYKSFHDAHGYCQPLAKRCPLPLRSRSIRPLRALIVACCVVVATSALAQSDDNAGTNPSWAD